MKKTKSKASSSAAAEMLGSAGGFGGGFGSGFGSAFGGAFAGLVAPAAVAEETTAATADNEPDTDGWAAFMHARTRAAPEVTDPTLVLAFKQLSKRDPVTRLKALDSLATAFTDMTPAEAVHTLPAWLIAQERLHLDCDRRVRESIWSCFGLLRSRASKQFAPHLRAAFPLWWTHRSDPCKEVARAATREWTSAFPTHAKQTAALAFCHREYFTYCTSLFAHTPATLSDDTVYPIEERLERWERATVSAIASIADFIDLSCAPAPESEPASTGPAPAAVSLAAYTALLPSSLLSKFAQSRNVHIRRAFYVLLQSLVTRDPAGFVSANMSTLAPLVACDLLGETDRVNHTAMLECTLSFLRSHGSAAWSVLQRPGKGGVTGVASAFYPRLQHLLRSGLGGNYSTVYPGVLPLLSLLPDEVMKLVPDDMIDHGIASGSIDAFHAFFFRTLWSARGTLHDAAGASISLQGHSREVLALVDSYMECILYSVKRRRSDNASDRALQRTIVTRHLLADALTPALHFACARVTPERDPSVTQEAVQQNRFGAPLFERGGRTLREVIAVMNGEDADEVYEQIGRACTGAIQTGANTSSDDSSTPIATPTPSTATMPHKRNNASAAAAQPIDEYLAVGLVLAQLHPTAANSAVSPSLLRAVGSVFQLALGHFAERPFASLSPLRLCVQLAEAYSISALLGAAPSTTTLSTFLSSSLLPVLRRLLTVAGNATATEIDGSGATHATYLETVDLFARGLLARTLDDLGSGGAPVGAWEELLQLVSSSPISSASSVTAAKLHLGLLRVLFASVFARCASVHGNESLQDLIVTQAEHFLTCERSELLHEYVAIFRTVVSTPGLLATEVLSALVSSFLDAIDSFRRLEEDLLSVTRTAADADSASTSEVFVRRFETETGAVIQALPSLVEVVGDLLVGDTLVRVTGAPSEAEEMRRQITRAVFWLQHSQRKEVASVSSRVWSDRVDRAQLRESAEVVLEIASVFRARLLSAPLVALTSRFILAWSTWLAQLVDTVAHPAVQQRALDAALPTHDDLRGMIAGVGADAAGAASLHDVAERLRVVRDIVSELSHAGIAERALFLGESTTSGSSTGGLEWTGRPRLGLLVDLLAAEEFLRSFERDADVTLVRQAEGALPLYQQLASSEDAHVPVSARLRTYVASNLLTGTQIVDMLRMALAESQATVAGSSATRAGDAARAYKGALRSVLSVARGAFFDGAAGSLKAANEVRALLNTFLTAIRVDQVRTHTHTALPESFERTLVAVLESGCASVVSAPAGVVETHVTNLSKWTQDGFDAGLRMTSRQNDRLLNLASLVRIQAAVLRALDEARRQGANGGETALTAAITTFRSRALGVAASLNLFEPLASGADGFTALASRFFEARASLLDALVSTAPVVDGASEPFDSTLAQNAVLWSVSVVKYASTQHAAAMETKDTTASAAWSLDYLATTFSLMANLVPALLPAAASTPTDLSAHAGVAAALHSFVSTCYTLLVSSSGAGRDVLRAISVKRFTAASMDLEQVLRAYREVRPLRLAEIVRADLRHRTPDAAVSNDAAADSTAVRALFRLLAHPMPSIALCALHLLSIGLLDRAIGTPINFEVDEAEEMAHVLAASAALQKAQSKREKKRVAAAAAAAAADGVEDEQAEIEREHQHKTMRNEYQRLLTQQRLDQLVPTTLQRILEERGAVNEVDVLDEAVPEEKAESATKPFFSHRPVSLQVRAQLLTWSLVLDLLSQSLPTPSDAATSGASATTRVSLSEEKSSLLLSHLRETDAVAPFASELVEHMLVSLDDAAVERFIMRTVKNYEHRAKEEAMTHDVEEVETVQAEPAVMIEDEDEDGNVMPALTPAAASTTTAATAAAPAPVLESIREFPLWHTPAMLVSNEPLAEVKVLPFLMKRLLRMRKSLAATSSDAESHFADDAIYYGHLACLLFLRTLRVLPALSRAWFTNIDRSNGGVISRLTAAAFSPLLIQDELLHVTQRQAAAELAGETHNEDDEEEFAITTNYAPDAYGAKSLAAAPAVVHAKFTRGEIVMGLSMKLPLCYPLVAVTVALGEQVKIKEEKSKKWSLAIASILSSADGSMYDAIQVWRRNLDHHFAGVSECTICYSVISAQNHALPRMRCQECNNRFHSSCLYKWFASSGNSKCPLCRTLFSA